MPEIALGTRKIGDGHPLCLIAGPCQLESVDHAQMIAGHLQEICAALDVTFVFKGSFDKANRTSINGERGPGVEAGLKILEAVGCALGVATITDVHSPEQCAPVAEVCDILQIPAFLCRQTDLLIAAGQTGRAVNVKKGQFLAPWDMEHVAGKIASTGNNDILLCERGTSFGYNTLVTDMRSLPQMQALGYPVIMDATHSVQAPGGMGGASGGNRAFAPLMARAAVAVGVAGVFIETHQNPDTAPSDGANMIPLDQMRPLVEHLVRLDQVTKTAQQNFVF